MDKETIFQSIDNKKFTEFETAMKQELDDRIANSDSIKSYKSDFEKIKDIKNTFAEINKKYSSQKE